jgi:DNA/RNA-binding domain of Phe-tRNA-synthetase-like protein
MQKATPIIFADDTSILITGQDTNKLQEDLTLTFTQVSERFNPLAPSDPYMGHTAQLTSRHCILNTYSTNIRT